MTVDLDLAYAPASWLAECIRSRKLSPVDVVCNSLARIEAVNPKLNCFCFTYPEEALARAKEAEKAVRSEKPLGPLHGVPFAIKDLTPTRGKRTTMGSYTREHWVPDVDAAVVEKLLAAGGIMVGKTTTPEFAHSSFTESRLWGVTRNPWNPNHTPGGSSGGSAAAVAAGCVPLAEGSDMGGSVRTPAAFCGIVGLKPSFGRIPFEIFPSQFDPTCHFGPLARTCDDAALFLSAAQGPDDRDFQTLAPALDVRLPLAHHMAGRRLAFSLDLGYFAIDREVEKNARAAIAKLAELGAHVEEVDLKLSRKFDDAARLRWQVYHAAMHGHLLDEWRDKMWPRTVQSIEAGRQVSAIDYKRTEFVMTELWTRLRPIFARFDALICPTGAVPPPAIPASEQDFNYEDADGRYHGLELTEPFTLVGKCPALSVPSGFTSNGLPTGIQIVGRRHDDLGVLEIGKALEEATDWARKRPSI